MRCALTASQSLVKSNSMSTLDTCGDLQALLGGHIIPGNEAQCLVTIHVDDIIRQVVYVKMERLSYF